jgi:hypothetical protein
MVVRTTLAKRNSPIYDAGIRPENQARLSAGKNAAPLVTSSPTVFYGIVAVIGLRKK